MALLAAGDHQSLHRSCRGVITVCLRVHKR